MITLVALGLVLLVGAGCGPTVGTGTPRGPRSAPPPDTPAPAPVSGSPLPPVRAAPRPGSPGPSPIAAAAQAAAPFAAPPAGWIGAAATSDGQELALYLPQLTLGVREPAAAVVVVRNPGPRRLNLVLPCRNYAQLVVEDAQRQIVFHWTREHYPTGPGLPAMPPCPRGERQLAAGEAVQVALSFTVPMAGPYRVVASRFGQPGPSVELRVTAT